MKFLGDAYFKLLLCLRKPKIWNIIPFRFCSDPNFHGITQNLLIIYNCQSFKLSLANLVKNVATFFIYINTGDNTNINYESLTQAYIIYLKYCKDLHNLVFIYLYSDTVMTLSDILKIRKLTHGEETWKIHAKEFTFCKFYVWNYTKGELLCRCFQSFCLMDKSLNTVHPITLNKNMFFDTYDAT